MNTPPMLNVSLWVSRHVVNDDLILILRWCSNHRTSPGLFLIHVYRATTGRLTVVNKTLLPSCDTATVLCHWEDMSTSEMIIQLSADANHGSTDILCTPMNDDVDLLLCFHAKVYLQVITCTERIQRAPFIEGALKSHCALWSCKVLG